MCDDSHKIMGEEEVVFAALFLVAFLVGTKGYFEKPKDYLIFLWELVKNWKVMVPVILFLLLLVWLSWMGDDWDSGWKYRSI